MNEMDDGHPLSTPFLFLISFYEFKPTMPGQKGNNLIRLKDVNIVKAYPIGEARGKGYLRIQPK